MEYLWAVLIFVGIYALTTPLTAFLGLLIPITYAFLGYFLGTESIIMGIGGLLGSLLNYYSAYKYIKIHGAVSNAPKYSIYASLAYIIVFIVTTILNLNG
ncbi:hypothetical protein E4S40_13015 [Algoriphagus kandeliae]|uniref:Uncharacterized protein n=1 Tax=Algoriphagus kandeliae TaxID=2562278 RepID=A0A4Y9QKG3_9BACT|nr:hypothetical protein [Algoriphagus kandeliae]TFV93179.1 hypothetical protein E4S40_13015 [Algoriphagus kandeliae]